MSHLVMKEKTRARHRRALSVEEDDHCCLISQLEFFVNLNINFDLMCDFIIDIPCKFPEKVFEEHTLSCGTLHHLSNYSMQVFQKYL